MRVALLYSKQPDNQYIGGLTGVDDSEYRWMHRLASQITPLLREAGIDVEMSPDTDYNRSGSLSYADNVTWVNDRHRVKAFDLAISLHSNAAGNACILFGKSVASATWAGKFQRALNAAKILPYNDQWEFNDRKVAETSSTLMPAILLEVGQHDLMNYAQWLRDNITSGWFARKLADIFIEVLIGVKPADPYVVVVPTTPAPTPEPKPEPTYVNPYVPLKVDGEWGRRTTGALQHVLRYKYNAYGLYGKRLEVDEVVGENTYRALQRVLNQEIKAGLEENGVWNLATKFALQRYCDPSIGQGQWGPKSTRALQEKLNKGF